ncbi:MAG: 6-bladed beta-propeller, partial [Gemmatimonadaceae bacterium]
SAALPAPPALPALIALLLVAAACGGDRSAATVAWSTVTDTIGDTVVVRTVGASDSAALLGLEPLLRIGETDGAEEYTFGYVGEILPAPHGDVYVWDGQANLLRRYDSSGTFVRQVGRKGGGPGEYDAPIGLDVLPDGRLAIWDARHQRVNVYDSTGTFVGSWRAATNYFMQNALRVDSAGRVNLQIPVGERDATGFTPIGIVRYTADGAALDTLVPPALPTSDALSLEQKEGQNVNRFSFYIEYVPQPSWTMSPLGYLVSTPADRYAITLARPDGPLRIERDVPAVPVDAAERSQIERSLTRSIQRPSPGWRWNGPPVPDRKPPIDGLVVHADGRIWVARSFASVRVDDPDADSSDVDAEPLWRSPGGYDVFAADGHWLGHLPLPRGTALLHMRGDTAWGTVRDSLDVQRVVRFRITGMK